MSEEQTNDLGSAIRKMLKTYSIESRFKEADLINSWPVLVGNTVAGKTSGLYIRNKTLFVTVHSAPLKQELFNSRQVLLNRIAEEFGEGLVKEIKFL